jgi:hypothetical protein
MTQHIVTKSGGKWMNAAEDRIDLVDPDPTWALQYEAEASALAAALSHVNGIRLEHFGSTAIPGIRAKPVDRHPGGPSGAGALASTDRSRLIARLCPLVGESSHRPDVLRERHAPVRSTPHASTCTCG